MASASISDASLSTKKKRGLNLYWHSCGFRFT
ncbi:hypothetical protein GLYMA_19G016200v4 [Glycine max]|uniref:Uncharacterized protein n=1 Tax=Glycine max TaxID=3847 RepID=A0A0R0EGX3_SOYBN|nr:hypothetical protein GYH30_051729 [Glycine max]KRG93435.1 hypothetical protein GLYMA_19G016200v4 [Glycine max]